MIYQFIDDQRTHYPVTRLCCTLGVSPSGYYAWRQRPPSLRTLANQRLLTHMCAIHREVHETYGSPRMHAELEARGLPCNVKRVACLIRLHHLQARHKRKYRVTTKVNPKLPVAPNQLAQQFQASAPNEKWVSDITYIRTREGWLYLAVVMDLSLRRIIGWALARTQATTKVVAALQMAHQPDAPYQYSRMFEYFITGSILVALGIGIFAPEILAIFTREAYVPAAPYALVLLVFTGPIAVMTNFFSISLYAHKRTHLLSVALIIVAIANIVLNLVLDPLYGVWGAVWATPLAGRVWAAIIYIFSQHVMPISYQWSRVATLISVYGVMVAAFLLLPELYSNLWAKLAAVLTLIAFVLISGLIPIG
jgi:hypothetical protein